MQVDEDVFSSFGLTKGTMALTAPERQREMIAILGDKPFLFGAEPHAADASVYGSVGSALCPNFETPIRGFAESHANLVAYAKRCTARWFPEIA